MHEQPAETSTVKTSDLHRVADAYWSLCALKQVLHATSELSLFGSLVGVIADQLSPMVDGI